MVEASEAKPGRFYRRTKNSGPTVYFTVPKSTKLTDLVKRWERREHTSLTARDAYWLHAYRADPNRVLLVRHTRTIDPMTGNRSEYHHYILAPADLHLREVQRPPGYTSGRTA